VFFCFPAKEREQELLAQFAREDAAKSAVAPPPDSGAQPEPAA